MRFSQMQDIAGCRIVVNGIAEQDHLCAQLADLFAVTIFDRRDTPSHGYRAVHVVVRNFERLVEIQVRTSLQHAWAEFSEKTADMHGHELKYGHGPSMIRRIFDEYSVLIADFEHHIEDVEGQSSTALAFKREISDAIAKLTAALTRIK